MEHDGERTPAVDSTHGSTGAPSGGASDEGIPVGQACGVCRFPVGPDQICGNPVYATQSRGTLPKYCGAPGQAQYQQIHGTPGQGDHRADRAGYARKTKGEGITAARTKELAEVAAVELGIHQHRAPRPPSMTVVPAADETTDPVAESAGSEDSAAEAAADVEAAAFAAGAGGAKATRLTEMLRDAAGVVAELAAEMVALRAECDERVEQEAERAKAAEAAAEKAARERDTAQSEARAKVEAAEAAAAAARDDKLRVEGELSGARARVAELEQQIRETAAQFRAELAEQKSAHGAELAAVRAEADSRVERIVATFAQNRPADHQAAARGVPAPAQLSPDAPGVQQLRNRVANGQVTRGVSARVWYLSNAEASRPAARTLDWMASNGIITVEPGGDPARVTLQQERR